MGQKCNAFLYEVLYDVGNDERLRQHGVRRGRHARHGQGRYHRPAVRGECCPPWDDEETLFGVVYIIELNRKRVTL